jgi:F-type H+-transporting ATPase subunit b
MAPKSDVTADGNFLLPNGTFFAELIIFLIVLGVIWIFVVPPIRKVLAEREAMVRQTTDNTKEAAAAFADAETQYRAALADARGEAGKIRDQARADGQATLDQMRGQAKEQADMIATRANAELGAQGDQIAAELSAGIGPLSQALADRVLGIEGERAGNGVGGYDQVGRG